MVYVSCADDKLIAGYEMDGSGRLHEISRTAVPGSAAPSPSSLPLAVSQDRRWMYAALRGEPFPLSTFAIDPATGALTLAGTARLPDSMCYLSTDRTGTRLFSASYGGAILGVTPIRAGIAGDIAQVIATPPKAHCARPDPDFRFVYTACLGGDVILAQRIEDAGLDPVPHPVARTRPGAGPRHVAFTRDGHRLYCLNELDGTVNAYNRDRDTGALREIQSISLLTHPVPGGLAAADIHLTPDERFLYASERKTNTLAGFRVEHGTGLLSPIAPVPSEPNPRGFAIASQGPFLLCAGMESGTVATYAIDSQSGELTRLGAVSAGAGANWVEVLQFG